MFNFYVRQFLILTIMTGNGIIAWLIWPNSFAAVNCFVVGYLVANFPIGESK